MQSKLTKLQNMKKSDQTNHHHHVLALAKILEKLNNLPKQKYPQVEEMRKRLTDLLSEDTHPNYIQCIHDRLGIIMQNFPKPSQLITEAASSNGNHETLKQLRMLLALERNEPGIISELLRVEQDLKQEPLPQHIAEMLRTNCINCIKDSIEHLESRLQTEEKKEEKPPQNSWRSQLQNNEESSKESKGL